MGAILALAVSASLLFVGVLWSAMIALGHKHYLFGLGILLFFPTALVYCWCYRDESKEASRFLYPGFVLTTICAVPMWWLSTQLIAVS
ncbi:hypothetical protein [Ferrimonas lipolytica]|uniref:Uncharacterized protein n=1 Tax=Ferrimonas lipolytica TaxID=2724191 RepID=A0A6H1UGP3_9GAMM|nr:hypothetical protein [Ferrimonas lipolytica]QIZ76962.1 hypothetical protein HER31_08775 [Ferrimonas lipolytica]